MSRNGSGSYSPPGASFPAVAGTTILSASYNNVVNDIASALTQSIANDGQTIIAADLPMGGFKFTGLAVGASAADSVRYDQLPVVVTGSFTITGTGFTVSPTATATYKIVYGYVYLHIPESAITGTSNATSFTLTGLPVAITPSATRQMANGYAFDNSVATWTAITITTSNTIALSKTGAGSAWTSSGTKTLKTSEFIYLL